MAAKKFTSRMRRDSQGSFVINDKRDVDTETSAGSIAESISQIVMAAGPEMRQKAYQMIGVDNSEDLGKVVERRLNEVLENEEQRTARKMERRSILVQRKERDNAIKLLQQQQQEQRSVDHRDCFSSTTDDEIPESTLARDCFSSTTDDDIPEGLSDMQRSIGIQPTLPSKEMMDCFSTSTDDDTC